MGRHPQVDSPLHFWISVLNTAVCRKRAVCSVKRAVCSVKRAVCSVKRAVCSVKRALLVVKRALCFDVHSWISVLNTVVCGIKSNEFSEEPYMLSKEPYALISTARSRCQIQWYVGEKPCVL